MSDYVFIVGANFNAVWNLAVDKSRASETPDQRQASAVLWAWARDTGLVDMWHMVNPSSKDFSLFSLRHKTFSRIDYLFTSPNLFDNFDVLMLCLIIKPSLSLLHLANSLLVLLGGNLIQQY